MSLIQEVCNTLRRRTNLRVTPATPPLGLIDPQQASTDYDVLTLDLKDD